MAAAETNPVYGSAANGLMCNTHVPRRRVGVRGIKLSKSRSAVGLNVVCLWCL